MIPELRARIAEAAKCLGEIDKLLAGKNFQRMEALPLAKALVAMDALVPKLAKLGLQLRTAAANNGDS